MASHSVIPAGTDLHDTLEAAARSARCVVFPGLPGIGKSLLTQQTALLAHDAGRGVSLIQWDVVRTPFDGAPYDALYPEVDGVTHPVIRSAVDIWLRGAIGRWLGEADGNALLLIEAPLIGGRLMSLTREMPDRAEGLLASEETVFLLPVPTAAVKDTLRKKRAASLSADPAQPDAAVNVLDALVEEINDAAIELGLTPKGTRGYDPAIYAAVYLNAMRGRAARRLVIDRVFDLPALPLPWPPVTRLDASPSEVAHAIEVAASVPVADRDRQLAEWYR